MTDHASELHQLADAYRAAEQAAKIARRQLDQYVQALKRDGWGFRDLAKETGLAQGTIQNIIASDPLAPQYWRKRCTRKAAGGDYCDEVWIKNVDEWCESCRRGWDIEQETGT